MPRLNFVTLAVVVVAVSFSVASLWMTADALNVKLSGVNYDLRQGPDWDPQRCKPGSKISREMKILNTVTNRVRIYSLSDCNPRQVFKSAKELNMTVWLGVWVSNKTSVFREEFSDLRTLISEKLITDELVDGINVGSEVLYRNESTAADLIEKFNKVKALLAEKELNISVSITDTLGKLVENPEIVKAIDVITLNQFPFWNNIDIESAVSDLKYSVESLSNMTKSKPFFITETGWAAGGFDDRSSETSPENAARYMKEFFLLAEEKGWKYYYFSAFDAAFLKRTKTTDNSVEGYFGIFNESGKLNHHYANLTIPAKKKIDGETTELVTNAPSTKAPAGSDATSQVRGGAWAVVAPLSLLLATWVL